MDKAFTDQIIGTIKSAASKLTGFKRRQYMAEVTLQYCDGSAQPVVDSFERLFSIANATFPKAPSELTRLACAES